MKEFDEVHVTTSEGGIWSPFGVPEFFQPIKVTVEYIKNNHPQVKAIRFRKDGEDVDIYDVVKGDFRSNILKQTTIVEYGGAIAGFPKEVVEKMLDEQERQGNKRDVSIFERRKAVGAEGGGINRGESKDGISFWDKVISDKDFDTFFKEYPKSERKCIYEAPKPKFKIGDKVKNRINGRIYEIVENYEYDNITEQWLISYKDTENTSFIAPESRFDLYRDDEFPLSDFRKQVADGLMAYRGKVFLPTTKTSPDIVRFYTAFGAKKGDNETLILSSKSGVIKVSQDI